VRAFGRKLHTGYVRVSNDNLSNELKSYKFDGKHYQHKRTPLDFSACASCPPRVRCDSFHLRTLNSLTDRLWCHAASAACAICLHSDTLPATPVRHTTLLPRRKQESTLSTCTRLTPFRVKIPLQQKPARRACWPCSAECA